MPCFGTPTLFCPPVGMFFHIPVIYVHCDVIKQLSANLICLSVKNNDIDHHLVFQQKFTDGIDCNLQSLVFWIAVNTGGNQRKGYRLTAIFFRQIQRCPITGFQKLPLPMPAIPPARTDCMDHIFAGQTVSFCDFCTAGFAAMQRTAFCKQFRSGRTMNAAIHTTAAQKGRVGSIDDCVNVHFCNIVSDYLQRHEAPLPFVQQLKINISK